MSVININKSNFRSEVMNSEKEVLLDFKFRLMKWKGCRLIEPPISAGSNFLRDMDIPDEPDYS